MSLHAKLLAAQIAVAVAEKTARNEHHAFNYAAADTVSALAKDALNTAGLTLVNTAWSIDPAALTVKGTFLLCDSETDERMELACELPYVPGKGRPEDKAALASLTEMRGYLAIGLLGIERIEPIDVSGRDDTSREQRDEPRREALAPQRQQQQQQRADDGRECRDCGASMKFSEKSGKWYCSDLCWKKAAPAGNGRDY